MGLFSQLFTWWDGQSLGTRLWTARHGAMVGEDEQGNIYYQSKDGVRRWVIYNGEIEASRISPEWHGWLHHTFQNAPTVQPFTHKPWEKPHVANMTGTVAAYHPPGSMHSANNAPRADYQAWVPE